MIWLLLSLPLIGSLIGASLVFVIKESMPAIWRIALLGLAGGILMAACFFALILPALDQSETLGVWSFIPCTLGLLGGGVVLYFLDHYLPHIHLHGAFPAEKKALLLVAVVSVHSIPEGIAIGAEAAHWISSASVLSAGAVFTLSLAMAIHHIPESAVLAIPLRLSGMPSWKAFGYAIIPGLVVPAAAGVTFLSSSSLPSWLPWLMGFAAGAMIYVVVDEIIPQLASTKHSHEGVFFILLGIALMIVMEVLFE